METKELLSSKLDEDFKIRNIYDLAYIYGLIEKVDSQSKAQEQGQVSEDYVKYMTPYHEKVRQYFGEERSYIALQIEETEDGFEFYDIVTRSLDEKISVRCGYSRPFNKTSQSPHSLTRMTSSSGYDVENVVKQLKKRLSPTKRSAWMKSITDYEEELEEHDDFELFQKLKSYGESIDDDHDKIESGVAEELEGKSRFKGLITIEIVEEGEERMVGEIDVLNECMKLKKEDRFSSFSEAKDCVGEGVCFVTGEEGVVYGLFPGSPLNYTTGKQVGFFQNLNPDNSWKSRGVSMDAAMLIQKGSWFIDEIYKAITSENDRVSYIPYINTVTNENIGDLYEVFKEVRSDKDFLEIQADWMNESLEGDNTDTTNLTGDIKKQEKDETHRLYSSLYLYSNPTIYKVFKEETNIEPNILQSIQESISGLNEEDDFVSMHYTDDSFWFNSNQDLVKNILNGKYFNDVAEVRRDEDSEQRSEIVWFVFNNTLKVIGNERVSYDELLRNYSQRVGSEQKNMISSSEYDGVPVPSSTIIKQYLHLVSLIESDNILSSKNISVESYNDEGVVNMNTKLNSLVKDSERETAFLIGDLVGRLGYYQANVRDNSETVLSQFTVDSMSKDRMQRVISEVLGDVMLYTDIDDEHDELFSKVRNDLHESLQEYPIEEWDITTDELRFYYSLGISHGHQKQRQVNYARNNNGDKNEGE